MYYILIVLCIALIFGGAYIFTLRSEIQSQRSEINSKNGTIESYIRDLERLGEYAEKQADEKIQGRISEMEMLVTEDQMKRWYQLVEDCKQPFTSRKKPINVGGKFTRTTIIAVGNIIDELGKMKKTEVDEN